MARAAFVPASAEQYVVRAPSWHRVVTAVLLAGLVLAAADIALLALLDDPHPVTLGMAVAAVGLCWVPLRGRITGGVLLAVGADGVYLGGPAQWIPWSRITEIAQLCVSDPGPDGFPLPSYHIHVVAERPEAPVCGVVRWGVDLDDLRAAVHHHAPQVEVRDRGRMD